MDIVSDEIFFSKSKINFSMKFYNMIVKYLLLCPLILNEPSLQKYIPEIALA